MPILERRYANRKVYRPTGTKYATGEAKIDRKLYESAGLAISNALENFRNEFAAEPGATGEIVVIEVTFDGRARAAVYEFPEEG